MSDLDLLPRSHGREVARFSLLQWLDESTERITERMPLTTSQREHLLQMVVERIREQTGATGAAVALEQFGQVVCRASSGETAPDVGTPLRLLEGSFTARCIQSGAPLRCDDSETDPRVNSEACRVLGIRSMLVVPVRAHDRIMGVVEVLSDQPRAFTNAHQTRLEATATVISSAFFPDLPDASASETHDAEHSGELHQVHGPAPAKDFDDGTWGESEEIEEAVAPPPTMFAGLHIRRPEIRKSAVVAFAAITFVACAGTLLLTRSPQRTVGGVESDKAPAIASEPASPPVMETTAAPVAKTLETAAATPSPTQQRKRAAKTNPEGVSAPVQRPMTDRDVSPPSSETEATPAALPGRAQIIGDPVYRVDPIYPQQAIDRHLEGTVVLSAIVDKEGRVQTVSIISGDPVFRGPAINAVKHWRYNPTIINGEAIEAETQVRLDFVLER